MSEESQYSEHPGGWIEWFCTLPQNQYLCEVDEEYISDPNNFESFYTKFPQFPSALSMILSPDSPDSLDLENEKFLEVYSEACDIYGLLHAQFIQTLKGLAIMRERFLIGRFGHCPRIMCEKQNVIPIGLSEQLRTSRVKIYCPRCKEAYGPRKSQADFDGCYIGRSFPQLLLMTYPDIHPKFTMKLGTPLFVPFEPTLYGFKVANQDTNLQIKESNKEVLMNSKLNNIDKENTQQKNTQNELLIKNTSQNEQIQNQESKKRKRNKRK